MQRRTSINIWGTNRENCFLCSPKRKSSVQEGIDEFICAHGSIGKPFDKDLFRPKSALGLLLHETKTKQTVSSSAFFNTAWVLEESGKTVVVYSLGDGKSRILTFTCLAGLKSGMFKKVYLVFGNKHLMERDRADFKDLKTSGAWLGV